MANKMLIDAAHPEETRVVVLRGNRVEEFDFESANRRQLRGNIYLAKVTRVEPSLQAAFIDYGGNRHGFLAFSEIHPDYYQIPVADRQALIAEDERAHRAAEAEHENRAGRARPRRRGRAAEHASETVKSDVVDIRPEADAEEVLLAEVQAETAAAETAAFNRASEIPDQLESVDAAPDHESDAQDDGVGHDDVAAATTPKRNPPPRRAMTAMRIVRPTNGLSSQSLARRKFARLTRNATTPTTTSCSRPMAKRKRSSS